ncbi:MAG: alkaline phosphatase family protein [Ignavibacteria bacterium]
MKIKISYLLLLFVVFIPNALNAQKLSKPKLVVGIIVDQMRFDYLYRFKEFYGKGGFNRLMSEGTNFTYAHCNSAPAYTACGHASVYTGSTPFYHGIIANNWYDRVAGKLIDCVNDTTVKSVGCDGREGEMSPFRLLSTTITDQLKLATHGRSKVISISLKDRAAILPGGRFADAAYWFNENTGDMITSTYYMNALPEWVTNFNRRKMAQTYLSGEWKLLRDEAVYKINSPDDSKNEYDVFNEGKTSFPHKFDKVKSASLFESFESTPGGNEMVKEFAIGALRNEKLGLGAETDFLAVSFTSTDFIGHDYGNFSYEIQDAYIRLDLQIAELLDSLDKQSGDGNYLLFLTADHAMLDTPGFLKENRLPNGELGFKKSQDSIKAFCRRKFGDSELLENYSNGQLFISRASLKRTGLNLNEVTQDISGYLRDTFSSIASIYSRCDLEKQVAQRNGSNLMANGFNPARSGDIIFSLQPGFLMNSRNKGSNHGAPYTYDTHVPMIYYGWGIPKAVINTPVYIVDIAATVADILKITEPAACIGIPLINQVSAEH